MKKMDEKAELAVAIIYTLTAAASVTGSTMIAGVDLLQPLTTAWELTVDYATIGSAVALLVVWWYNRPQITQMDSVYQVVSVATVGLVVYGSFSPAYGADWAIWQQLIPISVSLAGYWALADN